MNSDIPTWQLQLEALETLNAEWEMLMDDEYPYWREYLTDPQTSKCL